MSLSLTERLSASDRQMVEAFAVNDRMNQLILEHLPPEAWRGQTPGRNARTIAGIFAHMHNVRRKWLRLSARQMKLPAEIDRARSTVKQTADALAVSAKLCCKMLSDALADPETHIFLRDGWSRAWQPGPAMLAYMICHEAHHRGQICMLAHQLGFPLPIKVSAGIWNWEKLWKECGSNLPAPHTHPRGRNSPARSSRGRRA